MLSILGVSFVEILKNEWLGIIASAFVLVSFLFSKQTITRLINICGCIVFVVYGILLPAYSTAFMNAALIVVHIVYLVKDYLARKKSRLAQADETGDESSPDAAQNNAQDNAQNGALDPFDGADDPFDGADDNASEQTPENK